MVFDYPQKVLFKHCDPAGLVFYPRCFEMINDCVEAFFAEALDWPFETLHGQSAVPTAEISARFTAPSRHGDRLLLRLKPTSLGRASLALTFRCTCRDEERFTATSTLVFVDASGKPTPWPDEIRERIGQFTQS